MFRGHRGHIPIIIFILLMYVFWMKHDECYNLCDPQNVVFMKSQCTDKKENKIFLLYKEIQMGSVAWGRASQYMWKCANI
jgi:hypothetical protein